MIYMRDSVMKVSEVIASDAESSLRYKISLQEETFTEMALLRMLMYQEALLDKQLITRKYLAITTHTKTLENTTGVDFEWWVYFKSTKQWVGMFFQAKKYFYYSPRSMRNGASIIYPKDINQYQQCFKLIDYANSQNAIPLYCFYNPKRAVSAVPGGGWTYNLALEIAKEIRNVQSSSPNKTTLYVPCESYPPLWQLFGSNTFGSGGSNNPRDPNNSINRFLRNLHSLSSDGFSLHNMYYESYIRSETEVPSYVKKLRGELISDQDSLDYYTDYEENPVSASAVIVTEFND